MDSAALWGSVGVIATILFGIAGVYLVIRKRYPIRLLFLVGKEIALFDEIVRNLPELSVAYDGKPVAENLVLLKGVLLNVGERDIAPDMVHKALEARLNNGFSWRTATVVDASPNVSASLRIAAPQALAFDLGLLRRDEHLTLQAVAEVPPKEAKSKAPQKLLLRSIIQFDHRIVDAAPVKIQDMPAPLPKRRRVIAIIFPFYSAALLLLLLLVTHYSKFAEFHYAIVQAGQHRVIEVRPRLNGTVDILDQKGNSEQKITLAAFEALNPRPIIAARRAQNTSLYAFTVAIVILSVMFYVPICIEWQRARKLRRLLGGKEAEAGMVPESS